MEDERFVPPPRLWRTCEAYLNMKETVSWLIHPTYELRAHALNRALYTALTLVWTCPKLPTSALHTQMRLDDLVPRQFYAGELYLFFFFENVKSRVQNWIHLSRPTELGLGHFRGCELIYLWVNGVCELRPLGHSESDMGNLINP